MSEIKQLKYRTPQGAVVTTDFDFEKKVSDLKEALSKELRQKVFKLLITGNELKDTDVLNTIYNIDEPVIQIRFEPRVAAPRAQGEITGGAGGPSAAVPSPTTGVTGGAGGPSAAVPSPTTGVTGGAGGPDSTVHLTYTTLQKDLNDLVTEMEKKLSMFKDRLSWGFALQDFSKDDFQKLKALLRDGTSIDSNGFDHATFAEVKKKIIPTAEEFTHSTEATSSSEAYRELSFTKEEVDALKVFLAVRGNQVLSAKLQLSSSYDHLMVKELKEAIQSWADPSSIPQCMNVRAKLGNLVSEINLEDSVSNLKGFKGQVEGALAKVKLIFSFNQKAAICFLSQQTGHSNQAAESSRHV